jgi:hypothetical protein
MRAARVLVGFGCCLLVLALSGGGTAAASWGSPALLVSAMRGEYPYLRLSLSFADERGAPGRIALYTPLGAALYPARPPGSPIGEVDAYAASDAFGAGASTHLYGTIVAAADDASVQACSPGTHLAIWKIELSLLGQQLQVPVAISRAGPGDPPDTGLKLELCPPSLPAVDEGQAGILPLADLELTLEDTVAPVHRGSHLWRALVTPLAPDQHTLLDGGTYELRGRTPVPNKITLAGRYDASTKNAQLRGQLAAYGVRRARVPLTLVVLARRVSPKGISYGDRAGARTVSDAAGVFHFRHRIAGPTSFIAVADEVYAKCTGKSIAPAGCLSDSIAQIQSEPVTVAPPRPS